jgi:hypothetical protein
MNRLIRAPALAMLGSAAFCAICFMLDKARARRAVDAKTVTT